MVSTAREYSLDAMGLVRSNGQVAEEGKALLAMIRAGGRLRRGGDDLAVLRLGERLRELDRDRRRPLPIHRVGLDMGCPL